MEGYGNENPGAFQPTRPLRGATAYLQLAPLPNRISTHAPLAGRDIMDWFGDTFFIISTHAPLAGRDCDLARTSIQSLDFNPRAPCGARLMMSMCLSRTTLFQPTRPLRGATVLRRSS